ncbi:MAG: PQQ-dependent dehydrogenase, methanol/ethanol family, partial [Candidatus Binatia bacterium]
MMWRILGAVIASCCLFPSPAAAQDPKPYRAVTAERLLHPEPENWLMYRGTYDSWGYSPLDQITTKNVDQLVPVWTFSTGVEEGHQSPPI